MSDANCAPANPREDALAFAEAAAALVTPDTASRVTSNLVELLRTLDDLAQYGASDALARLRDAYVLAREDLEARPHPPSVWEILRLLGDPYVRTKIWLILRTLRGV